MLSLMVILGVRTFVGEVAFADWGWRVPFLASIRLSLNESPAFKKLKAQGKVSKAPLTESFGRWKNAKIVLPPPCPAVTSLTRPRPRP